MVERLASGLRAVAAVALLGLCGCTGGGSNPPSGASQKINVTVALRSATHPPTGGYLLLGGTLFPTDLSGNLEIPEVTPGDYSVTAHDGVELVYRTIHVDATSTHFEFLFDVARNNFSVGGLSTVQMGTRVNVRGMIDLLCTAEIDATTLQPEDFEFSPNIGPVKVTLVEDIFHNLPKQTILITPRRELPVNFKFNVRLVGDIRDTTGRKLAVPLNLQFVTEPEDLWPPLVLETSPPDGTLGFPINGVVLLEFNEPVASFESAAAYIFGETEVIALSATVSGTSVVLSNPVDWLANTSFRGVGLTGVKDAKGNRLDSTPTLHLTTGTQRTVVHNFQPEWSSALNSIIFASDRLGSYDIYRIDPDGTSLAPLTTLANDEFNPTVSADGQLLAWQAREPGEDWDIFVAPLSDTSSSTAITPSDANDTEPRFARTSSRSIVCVSDRLTTPLIFRMAADGSGYSALSPSFGSVQHSPSPHPLIDNQLLFTSTRDGGLDVWNMSVSAIDGEVTALNQTNTLSFAEMQPDWGADASYFVYVSDQGGTPNLWLGDLTGNNRRVTSFDQALSDPCVSPVSGASRCVASLARADGGSDLVIIDLVGGTLVRNLTAEAGD